MKGGLLSAVILLICSLGLPGAKTLGMWPECPRSLCDLRQAPPTPPHCLSRRAGVEKLDILVTTHYDLDHVSSTPDENPPDEYIADLQGSPDGKCSEVAAEQN